MDNYKETKPPGAKHKIAKRCIMTRTRHKLTKNDIKVTQNTYRHAKLQQKHV